jgi:hypothetical protein
MVKGSDVAMTEIPDPTFWRELGALTNKYREQCLWYLRHDFVPSDVAGALRVLSAIEAHADRDGYVRARELKQWLLRTSNAPSAG